MQKNFRQCVQCRKHLDRKQMLRICWDGQSKQFLYNPQHWQGRSTFICYQAPCLESMIQPKRLAKIWHDAGSDARQNLQAYFATLVKRLNCQKN